MAQVAERTVMSPEEVRRALARIAHEVLERSRGGQGVLLVGVRTRGVPLAHRLARLMRDFEGVAVPVGFLDISLYRDDVFLRGPAAVEATDIPVPVDGRQVVLVDDVLFTGRTVRAAINELMDWGRPSRILLCVLVDRDGRELPIQADVVGRHVETIEENQSVEVSVPELDGRLGVDIVQTHPEAA